VYILRYIYERRSWKELDSLNRAGTLFALDNFICHESWRSTPIRGRRDGVRLHPKNPDEYSNPPQSGRYRAQGFASVKDAAADESASETRPSDLLGHVLRQSFEKICAADPDCEMIRLFMILSHYPPPDREIDF
jgi:hypothetical protein